MSVRPWTLKPCAPNSRLPAMPRSLRSWRTASFAVRGSLLDVFPMGSDSPYRIDLLDRDVDSIRKFDADSQRSLDKLDRIQLLPARETPLNPEAVREFRRRYRLRFTGDLSEQIIYRDVSQGIAPRRHRIFFCRCSSSARRTCSNICRQPASSSTPSRLPRRSTGCGRASSIVTSNCATIVSGRFWIRRSYICHRRNSSKPTLRGQRSNCRTSNGPPDTAGESAKLCKLGPRRAVRIDPRADQPAAELAAHIAASSARILLAAESAGRRELILDLLRGRNIQIKVFDNFASFLASDARLGVTVSGRSVWTAPERAARSKF